MAGGECEIADSFDLIGNIVSAHLASRLSGSAHSDLKSEMSRTIPRGRAIIYGKTRTTPRTNSV